MDDDRIDLERCLPFLPTVQRRVVAMRMGGDTLSDIGKEFHHSAEWARREEAIALRKLRNWTRYGLPAARRQWALRQKGMR